MRIVLIASCFFFSLRMLTAQEVSPAGQISRGIGFSAGPDFVMGAYSSVDKTNNKSGYASGGWQFQLTFDRIKSRGFGFSVQYTFQRDPLADTARYIVPDGWPHGTLGPGAWTNQYLIMGPSFMKMIGKLYVDARVMGGFIVSVSDNFSTPDPRDTSGTKIDFNLAGGFAWGIQAGAGYAFNPKFALKVNLALMGGWPGKKREYPSVFIGDLLYRDPVTGIVYARPTYSAPVDYEIRKVVTTFSPTLGVVYRF